MSKVRGALQMAVYEMNMKHPVQGLRHLSCRWMKCLKEDRMEDRKFYVLMTLFFMAMALCFSREAIAEDKDRYFEIGIGAGTDMLHGLGTEQALIAPAVNWKIKDTKSLWFRLEGDLELINYDSSLTFVVGAAPMLRLLYFDNQNKPGPFVEGGAGVNFISRHGIGDRQLGGSFVFSIMGGGRI